MANQPRGPFQSTTADSRAQVGSSAGELCAESVFEISESNLVKWMVFIDRLMPRNVLPARSKAAAAGILILLFNGLLAEMLATFGERTSLKRGTRAYFRAEFRNVIYACCQGARVFNEGAKAPVVLLLYEAFAAGGVGPHPDLDLAHKRFAGLNEAERDERERRFKSWFSHLRNRVAEVRRALDRQSGLSPRQRQAILGADPLIALELQRPVEERRAQRLALKPRASHT